MAGRALAVAVAAFAAAAVFLASVMLLREGDGIPEAETKEQIALLEMWNRPFVSAIVPEQHTQMLWNAASDDPHTDMHAAASSRNSANSLGGSDDDGGSQVYTKYDTFGSGSGDGNSMDSDLKSILPSSEFKDSSSSNNHQWDTSQLSNHDNWDQHSSDSSWGKDDSATSDGKAWLKQHSWDSNKDLKMKAELKKMYHKGINAISKSIASEAAEENNNSFFSKWAGGKSAKSKGSKGRKNPLSDKDMKLYKQAESSVKKDEEKKAPLLKAVHEAASKLKSSSTSQPAAATTKKESHDDDVKAKLQAADKLSASLAAKKREKKTPVQDLLKESAKIAVQSKHAKSAAAKKAVEANAKRLQEEIQEDFSHATAVANNIKTESAKLVGSKL